MIKLVFIENLIGNIRTQYLNEMRLTRASRQYSAALRTAASRAVGHN